jgi:hypothetical protein
LLFRARFGLELIEDLVSGLAKGKNATVCHLEVLVMKKLLCFAVLISLLSGCVYSNIRVPLDEDLWKTELGKKVGTASNYSILWLVAWGDAGVKQAAENGQITTINHMDMGIESYLFGAYIRRDTIVYGD